MNETMNAQEVQADRKLQLDQAQRRAIDIELRKLALTQAVAANGGIDFMTLVRDIHKFLTEQPPES